jgi:hypothetical protein
MFHIAKLQFEIELLDDLAPRGYWGSRLRGGFGDGLLLRLCPKANPVNLREHPSDCGCEYLKLFKPTQRGLGVTVSGPPLGGGADLPATFGIDPPLSTGYPRKGLRLVFNFTAIGPMCGFVSDCVAAFVRLGEIGLVGRDRAPAKFRVLTVRDQLAFGRSIYSSGEVATVSTKDVTAVCAETNRGAAAEVVIDFQTNVQVQSKDTNQRDPLTGLKTFTTFRDLMSSVARRAACLWQAYGDNWLGKEEYRRWLNDLHQKSREVATIERELEMRQLWGYSNNRNERKSLHGFIGRMRFTGDLSPFLELLRVGELVHIGSETTNGLGQYSMMLLPAGPPLPSAPQARAAEIPSPKEIFFDVQKYLFTSRTLTSALVI